MMQLTQEPVLRVLGPLFLVGALGAAAMSGRVDLPLLSIGAVGLFLCARWEIRGFGYALALLLVASFIGHFWGGGNHLWRFGLEGSIGAALLLTALAFEDGTKNSNALLEQIEARKQTIGNLEEELQRRQEEFSKEQVAAGERHSALQRQVEEVQTELSSFQVLNEVLRKQAAKLVAERDQAAADRLDLERRLGDLQIEIDDQAHDIQRISNSDGLKIQNEELFRELNAARVREEQTRQINETLVRIHAEESVRLEKFAQLQEMVQIKDGEIALLQERCEQLFSRGASSGDLLLKLEGEKEFFKDRLEKLQPELELKESRVVLLEDQLARLQARISETAGIEGLHRQLRAQFQEKDHQLQSARADRFKAETEAETLRNRVAELELAPDPLSGALRAEIERIETECCALAEENKHLEEIVSSLSVVKKKDSDVAPLNNYTSCDSKIGR